jgi:hypothetical protein
MPSTPDTSNTVLNTYPRAGRVLQAPKGAVPMRAAAAKQVSPAPLTIISEHEVLLGTAATTAVTPAFDEELEGADIAIEQQNAASKSLAAQHRSGWIATLAWRIRTSRERRSPHQFYAAPLDSEFIADARMAREMYRL